MVPVLVNASRQLGRTMGTICLVLLPSACAHVSEPIHDPQCGPWRNVPAPDVVPGSPVFYFKGEGQSRADSEEAANKAFLNALVSFGHFCNVAVTSEMLSDKYELRQASGTELRIEFSLKGSARSNASVVGVRTDLTCQEQSPSGEETLYRVWTLLSAPIASNENNCAALSKIASAAKAR